MIVVMIVHLADSGAALGQLFAVLAPPYLNQFALYLCFKIYFKEFLTE